MGCRQIRVPMRPSLFVGNDASTSYAEWHGESVATELQVGRTTTVRGHLHADG